MQTLRVSQILLSRGGPRGPRESAVQQGVAGKRPTFYESSANVREWLKRAVPARKRPAEPAGGKAVYIRPKLQVRVMQPMRRSPRVSNPPKVRATLYLSAEVLNEARNAAVHLAGYPARLTLTKLAENALRNELGRLKDRYNAGQDFPERGEDLKGGRPIAA